MGDTLKTFVDSLTNFIGTSVAGFFLTLATVAFFYSVVIFIYRRSKGGSSYGRGNGLDDAKSMLGWSILALALMFSIWGIVALFQTVFQNPSNNSIVAPSVRVNSASPASSVSGRISGAITPANAPANSLEDGAACTQENFRACKSGNCWLDAGKTTGNC